MSDFLNSVSYLVVGKNDVVEDIASHIKDCETSFLLVDFSEIGKERSSVFREYIESWGYRETPPQPYVAGILYFSIKNCLINEGKEAHKKTIDRTKHTQRLIARHYGIKNQCDICVEEMAELTKEISKCKRKNNYESEELKEEIADVENMVEQLSYLVGNRTVQGIKSNKIERQEKRMLKETLTNAYKH